VSSDQKSHSNHSLSFSSPAACAGGIAFCVSMIYQLSATDPSEPLWIEAAGVCAASALPMWVVIWIVGHIRWVIEGDGLRYRYETAHETMSYLAAFMTAGSIACFLVELGSAALSGFGVVGGLSILVASVMIDDDRKPLAIRKTKVDDE